MTRIERHPASFRDPAGFLFKRNEILYRQINRAHANEYARLMDSGLYQQLTKAGLLIRHVESTQEPAEAAKAFKVIQPDRIPFISYPYEWPFGALKDAALTTLSIQKRAMKFDMTLRDASAYNMQFLHGKVVLIDTLSLGSHEDGRPWDAYRQFCQHFLAPLALMSLRDVRLGQLLRVYMDGIPLDLASRLLPIASRFNLGLLTHIHLHAAAQRRYAGRPVAAGRAGMSRQALLGLINSLETTVRNLDWSPSGTQWGDYYDHTNYSRSAFQLKRQFVHGWTEEVNPAMVVDFGANTGLFSREAAIPGAMVISTDMDPAAVEQNYQIVKRNGEKNILPLIQDVTNPSPDLGWDQQERESFKSRGRADLGLGLAILHHLAISNNLPMSRLADFFAERANWLIIEFVPKSDDQVRKLLASRKDIFPDYTRESFEAIFANRFQMIRSERLGDSERILYMMQAR